MKNRIIFVLFVYVIFLLAARTEAAAPGPMLQQPTVIEQGAHHRKWEYKTRDDLGNGQKVPTKHSYVELRSGMSRWSQAENKWVDASENIELFQNGAVARNAQHQVIFNPSITDNQGTIDMLMSGNKRLRSRVMGIAYFEVDTEKSTFIAEIKDRIGALAGQNQIIYSDAFDAIKADVRYTMTVASFEQDILLKEQLPSPAQFGLAPEKTLVEVWTEFLEAPVPNKRANSRDGRNLKGDEQIDFGADSMFFGMSQAFKSIPRQNAVIPGLNHKEVIRVPKQWLNIQGRSFLIEAVPFSELFPLLQGLPKATASVERSSTIRKALANRRITGARQLPASLAGSNGVPKRSNSLNARIERATPSPELTVVMDYILVSGATDYTFKGDTTYYVSGNAYFYGTTTIEGGTVVKYGAVDSGSSSPRVLLYQGDLNCKTSAYRPAVFTAVDDNSVGEWMPGSTGDPSGYYAYECIAAGDYGPAIYVHDVKFCYAYCGYGAENRAQNELRHVQALNCYEVAYALGATVNLRNTLCKNCYYGMVGDSSSTVTSENMTYDGGTQLVYNIWNSTFSLTNCLIAGVGNTSGFSGSYNQISGSSSGLFQTIVGGAHYLAVDSPYRNSGTASINSGLLADLRDRTTYPPVVLGSISADTTIAPQAQRDTDAVDLGYHYTPLDYMVNSVNVSAALTLTNGVALGYSGSWGLMVAAGGKVLSGSTPNNLVHIARYRAVQENATPTWDAWSHSIYCYESAVPQPEIHLRFTEIDLLASHASSCSIQAPYAGTALIDVQDCQFRGGMLDVMKTGGITVQVNNCLFDRVLCFVEGLYVKFYNNTFTGGTFYTDGYYGESYTVKDNLFDRTSVYGDSISGNWTANNNAYVCCGFGSLYWDHNDLWFDSSYQTGPLGPYYFPSSSPLINAGSRTADVAGLYHYTVTTNQVKETTSTVDIGFHYVAVNGSNLPIDTDSDGAPDYLEDSNGNGLINSGETAWNSATDGGLKVTILRPKASISIP